MAEERFELIAQSRANYYTAGSPVQFVRVELLRGDVNGEIAVCLTFKNITDKPLKKLTVHYVCKASDGEILAEDDFTYSHLNTAGGELFGMDDAVVLLDKKASNVEVRLLSARLGRDKVKLDSCRRVRLPAPKRLSPEVRAALEQKVGSQKLPFQIEELPQGWFCACGAFHPKEESCVYCSECGGDRILWQNALNHIMAEESRRRVVVPAEPVPAAEPAAEIAPAAVPVPEKDTAPAAEVQQTPEESDEDIKIAPDRTPDRAATRVAPAPAAPDKNPTRIVALQDTRIRLDLTQDPAAEEAQEAPAPVSGGTSVYVELPAGGTRVAPANPGSAENGEPARPLTVLEQWEAMSEPLTPAAEAPEEEPAPVFQGLDEQVVPQPAEEPELPVEEPEPLPVEDFFPETKMSDLPAPAAAHVTFTEQENGIEEIDLEGFGRGSENPFGESPFQNLNLEEQDMEAREDPDALANAVIRLAPPITAGACLAVVLLGVLYTVLH